MEDTFHVKYMVNDDDVYAYFPFEKEGKGLMMCYSHIGQHSTCVQAYVDESREATVEEYTDLHKELLSIGYKLKIIE
jgi:hypothetical protein